jgi:hypothetical protein
MRKFKLIAGGAIVAALGLLIGGAGSALAATQGDPSSGETATVTVPSTITLSLGQSTVSFAYASGSTVTGSPNPTTWTVQTNDPLGYTAQVQATAFQMGSTGTYPINADALSHVATAPDGTTGNNSSAQYESYANTMTASANGNYGGYLGAGAAYQATSGPGDQWQDVWSLAIPAGLPAGTETADIEYETVSS